MKDSKDNQLDKKFSDQFFASTEGRNDIRREQIEAYTNKKIVDRLENIKTKFPKTRDIDNTDNSISPHAAYNTARNFIEDLINIELESLKKEVS